MSARVLVCVRALTPLPLQLLNFLNALRLRGDTRNHIMDSFFLENLAKSERAHGRGNFSGVQGCVQPNVSSCAFAGWLTSHALLRARHPQADAPRRAARQQRVRLCAHLIPFYQAVRTSPVLGGSEACVSFRV